MDYAPGEFVCWHFYAWRRGRILIMPAWYKDHSIGVQLSNAVDSSGVRRCQIFTFYSFLPASVTKHLRLPNTNHPNRVRDLTWCKLHFSCIIGIFIFLVQYCCQYFTYYVSQFWGFPDPPLLVQSYDKHFIT